MREPLEIVIHKGGLILCHPSDYSVTEFVARDEKGVTSRIDAFIKTTRASSSTIHLFVSEDLLFFKTFKLPLDTVDLREAIGYQLEMTTPFADETTWFSFSATRNDDLYRINLFAAQSGYIDAYIQEIMEGGYQLSGLYPESQRYVNKYNRKIQWGLLLPGRFVKAYVFNGASLEERLLCSAEPSFPEAVEVCKSDMIFQLDSNAQEAPEHVQQALSKKPFFDYLDARMLLTERPLLKDFNMLPASYQKPDYFKIIIAVLMVLNMVTFLALGAAKVYKLKVYDNQVDRQIEKIMPVVNEMKELRLEEEELLKAITQMGSIGSSFDFITFLISLTREMPSSSYVDQLRFDKQNNSVHVQGFTEDVSALTTELQVIGETQLKSTSRRKNKTYFHVEISLP